MTGLAGKVIQSATLGLWNHWSWNCNPASASVHKVTQAWSGASTQSFEGPTFEVSALATSSFAFGYSACPDQGWGTWDLPVNRVQAWVNGTESFHGLTVRASMTSSTGWKRFRSANYSNGNLRPFLEVTYVDGQPGW